MPIKFSCHKMLLSKLEEHLLKVELHCSELGLPYAEFENMFDISIRRILRKTLDFEREMGNYKEKILSENKENTEEINSLCDQLKLDPQPFLSIKKSNNYDGWKFLKEQVNVLSEKKKVIELEEFIRLKRQFLDLIDVLKKKDLDQSEKFIVEFTSKSPGYFPIDLIKAGISKLEELKDLNITASVKLLNSIERLLKLLRIPIETDPFLNQCSNDNNCSSLLFQINIVSELQKKLDHYLDVRKSQIKLCFENVRKDIKCLWETCNLSDEYKMSCNAIISVSENSENEENLCELEGYLCKLQSVSSKLISIDNKIKSHLCQFQELEDVEARLSDPEKFLNRGGRMLKDEALKKRLLHNLPKAETDIMKDIEDLRESVDLNFRSDLASFESDCKERWKQFNNKKCLEAQARHKNKMETLNQDMRYGSKPATVAKKHVAGHASKTADDVKKKVIFLKPHNHQGFNNPAMYAIDKGYSDESTYSNASCFENAKGLSHPMASSTPTDHSRKRFKPAED